MKRKNPNDSTVANVKRLRSEYRAVIREMNRRLKNLEKLVKKLQVKK